MGFRWEPNTKTDRLTVGRKLTSTSTAWTKSEAVNVLTPHSLLRPGSGKSYRYQRFGSASCTYPQNYVAPHPKDSCLCTPGRVDIDVSAAVRILGESHIAPVQTVVFANINECKAFGLLRYWQWLARSALSLVTCLFNPGYVIGELKLMRLSRSM
jgi:hypothetical protein